MERVGEGEAWTCDGGKLGKEAMYLPRLRVRRAGAEQGQGGGMGKGK